MEDPGAAERGAEKGNAVLCWDAGINFGKVLKQNNSKTGGKPRPHGVSSGALPRLQPPIRQSRRPTL